MIVIFSLKEKISIRVRLTSKKPAIFVLNREFLRGTTMSNGDLLVVLLGGRGAHPLPLDIILAL